MNFDELLEWLVFSGNAPPDLTAEERALIVSGGFVPYATEQREIEIHAIRLAFKRLEEEAFYKRPVRVFHWSWRVMDRAAHYYMFIKDHLSRRVPVLPVDN